MRSESELRFAVSRSRKDGYHLLFQQYHSYVYAIVWNRIRAAGTHEDAEECVSDVFLDIFLNFDQIDEGKLQSYIRTIAKRKAIDYFRKLTAHPQPEPLEDQTLDMAVSDENVEQDYELTELRLTLLDRIRSLGEPDTTIIMMKYYYDCKPEEIAQTVHLTRANVRKRLSRAMKRLKQMLDDAGFTANGGKK